MLNERTGQFQKEVHCRVTRQLKTEAQVGSERHDDLALKQNIYRQSFVSFGV